MKPVVSFKKATNVFVAALVAYSPEAFAQSGIFDDAEQKGNDLVNDFIDGPARLIALAAIVGAVVMFFLGRLPLKWLAFIVIGALLLGSADKILDFLMG